MTGTRKQQLTYIITDYIMLNLAWLGFNIVRYFLLPATYVANLSTWLVTPAPLVGQLVVPLGIMAIYWVTGYYNYNQVYLKSRVSELGNTLAVSFAATVIIYFSVLIDDGIPERAGNYEMLMLLWSMLFVPVYAARLLVTTRNIRRLHNGRLTVNVLVIGASRGAVDLAQRLDNYLSHMGMKVVGYVDIDGSTAGRHDFDRPVYTAGELERVCQEQHITSLVIKPGHSGMRSTVNIINRLYPLGLPMYLPADIYHLITSHGRLDTVIGEPLINISSARVSASTVNLKRTIDVIGSVLALVLLSPLLAGIAVAVKLDSRGPVLYRQERIGYRKRPFKINKFRTMVTDAEADGPNLSSADDPRVTRIGRTLRKYRLDELPQFWNVLIGEMSLVGPRPERQYYIDQLVALAPNYSVIHQVRPGITSLGMVKYGYASTVEQMLQRLRYDLLYIDNITLGTDLKILIHTVNTVITGRGI